MNKNLDFIRLRQEYPEFWYKSYRISDDGDAILLEYEFEIPGLTVFRPKLKILKKQLDWKSVESATVRNLAFQIGMVELISYWKCVCAPKVVVKCGILDAEQVVWWKKLYFNGLGELFYTNEIETTLEDFMSIECAEDAPKLKVESEVAESDGYLILIGGGKDSIVTLETLKPDLERDFCMIVNPKPVTRKCAELAGIPEAHVVEVERKIDENLLKLNQEGFINGHTPFSTMLAFVSYLVADLLGLKYTVASNESSANEANVCNACDQKVNHQYSKSFEFERDFMWYAERYLKAPVRYLSLLRPLNELQIAKIFAKLEKYHSTFKSCNVGSKGAEWVWCNNCAKCLFAFTILSPFLYREKLVKIFGEDLFRKEGLWPILQELSGYGETKPFDCVGTFEEVNVALSLTAQKVREWGEKLPELLAKFECEYGFVEVTEDLTARWNDENNLTPEQDKLLREMLANA